MDKCYFTSEIAKLLRPAQTSKYFQKQKDSIESVYSSNKKAPLGCTRSCEIPPQILTQRFGILTEKGDNAGDLIYTSEELVYQSVYSEAFYPKKECNPVLPAGVKSEVVDNSGEQVKELLNQNKSGDSVIIVPSSYAKKTNLKSKIRSENEFDSTMPESYPKIRAEDQKWKTMKRMRSNNSVEVLWNLLKKKNHSNFKDFISAFKAYQNSNDNGITLCDLQRMCQNFGISAPLHVIEKLISECDILERNGTLNYEEFIHSLNWKDILPENSNFKSSKYANDWREGINNPPEDVINSYRTTSSFYGDHKYPVNPRPAGLPGYKREIIRNKKKGVAEFQEQGGAPSMIQPSTFSKHGVFEDDLAILRSKEEIKSIFKKSGIRCSDEALNLVWEKVNRDGKASIGTVWNNFKKLSLLQCNEL